MIPIIETIITFLRSIIVIFTKIILGFSYGDLILLAIAGLVAWQLKNWRNLFEIKGWLVLTVIIYLLLRFA